MSHKLILGIPNKGRLQKQTVDFLKENGLEIERGRGDRGYIGKLIGYDNIELIFLSPKEISLELMKGSIDLGVTGLDLVNEYAHLPDTNTHNILELGFGKADVVVAVPITWINVMSINDLEDVIYNFRVSTGKRLRIATKYPNISRNFFEKIGLSDYLLVDSHGATEGAPAYGSSEIISSNSNLFLPCMTAVIFPSGIFKTFRICATVPILLRSSFFGNSIFESF